MRRRSNREQARERRNSRLGSKLNKRQKTVSAKKTRPLPTRLPGVGQARDSVVLEGPALVLWRGGNDER